MNTDNNTIDETNHELHVNVDAEEKTLETADKTDLSLNDLGEVGNTQTLTLDQMKRFRAFVNGKLNHFKKLGNSIEKRRNKNKIAKKSRKKNRNK